MFLHRFLCTLVFVCSLSAPALAAEATFSWLPNSETNLAGYKVYYGTVSRNYTDVIDVVNPVPVNGRIQTTVANLVEGTAYFFAATAYDDLGYESDYSAEVTHTFTTGTSVIKIFGSTPDADYPGTLADTSTNLNSDVHEGAATISTWSWSSPTPHKVANTAVFKANLSSIPAAATITDAKLYLYQSAAHGESSYINTVHKITGLNPVISEVSGYNAAAGIPWSPVPDGTTYNNVPLGLANIDPAEDTVTLDSTLGYRSWQITSMVRQWVANPASNYGLLVNGQSGVTSETGRTFAASENSDANIRPKLVVTYSLDETAPPTAADSSVSGSEDALITGALEVTNPGSLPLQYTLTTNPLHGTLTIEDASGQFTYTPHPDFNGQDSFSFTAENDNGVSNTATVTIAVQAVNDRPSAQTTSFTTSEDTGFNGQLNASDADGDTLSYTLRSQASHGTAAINTDGTFTYTPAADWNGTDTFSFSSDDGVLDSNIATITMTVSAVNDLPTGQAAGFSGNEDSPISGQLNATDSDGDNLSYALATQTGHGTVTVGSTGAFTYTPEANWFGSTSFAFTASDGTGSSSPTTITLNINPVNDLPLAQAASFSTNEDTAVNGQLNATDIDADTLSYSLATGAVHGTVIVNTSGSFTYTPDTNWSGTDNFSFVAHDGSVNSNTANIALTVNAVNDIPVAVSQSISVDAGTPYNDHVSASDQEGDTLNFMLVSAPTSGDVTLNSNGTYSYTARQDAEGADSFTFKANDGTSDSASATVSISITAREIPLHFEISEVQADSTWQAVNFETPFTNPVVIARAASFNNNDTGVVRVRNITNTGFEVRFQEWDSLDGDHPAETITIMVVEQGTFSLDNGAIVEAGCFTASGSSTFSSISFQQPMTATPVVMTAVNSVNESDAVTTRIKDVTSNGFAFLMDEQEANTDGHAEETSCYLAWEPSTGHQGGVEYEVVAIDNLIQDSAYPVKFNKQFAEVPMILADMQTTDGADTAVLRVGSTTIEDMSVFVSEEQSADTELSHTTEAGGYIAMATYAPLGDPDGDALTTSDELNIYHTHPGLNDTDHDGLNDGAEITTWQDLGSSWDSDIDNDGLINLLDTDADGDGMSDGSEIAAGFNPANPASLPAFPIMEGGEVDVTSSWVHVDFTATFANPVVIARMVSRNDSEPCVVRVDNITGSGFDLRLQEYDYLDGNHPAEQVSYMVMEAGHYTLADGTQVEAGTFNTSAANTYDSRQFNQSFSQAPVIITSVASFNEVDTVTARIKNIDVNGFNVKLQEQEANSKNHQVESLAYIAWEPSSGEENGIRYEVNRSANAVTHNISTLDFTTGFSSTPLLYTDMQTTDGGDTATLRTVAHNSDTLQVTVEEEQSSNDEVRHTTEVAGFIAILGQ